MKKNIRILVIDKPNNRIYTKRIPNTLQSMEQELGCEALETFIAHNDLFVFRDVNDCRRTVVTGSTATKAANRK